MLESGYKFSIAIKPTVMFDHESRRVPPVAVSLRKFSVLDVLPTNSQKSESPVHAFLLPRQRHNFCP